VLRFEMLGATLEDIFLRLTNGDAHPEPRPTAEATR